MIKIRGLIAATFCAYKQDGSLNLDIIPSIIDKMIDDGLAGVFICGTNGEGPNLTIEERMAVAEAYVRYAEKRILVLVHVGHSSIAESRKLAAHAEEIGADAISSVAAFYFKPSSVTNLVESLAAIASAAPSLPFYYYHIPTLTGVTLDMVSLLEEAEKSIPSFNGIKYTASTLHEYQACLNYKGGKFDIVFGYDELLLPALATGARGAIGSTYNFAAPIYRKVMRLFAAGRTEEAAATHLHAVSMIRQLVQYPPIPAQRSIMKKIGFELGDCRLPLKSLTADQEESLFRSLDQLRFFDTIKQSSENLYASHEK